jgi:hypothetical protein
MWVRFYMGVTYQTEMAFASFFFFRPQHQGLIFSVFNRFFLFLAAISVKMKQTQFYFFTLAVLFNLISEFCNFNQLILLFIVIRVEMNQTLLLLFSFKLCY